MSVGDLLWILAVIIAVIVGASKFAGVAIPVLTPALMKDSTLSLFAALALALISRWI